MDHISKCSFWLLSFCVISRTFWCPLLYMTSLCYHKTIHVFDYSVKIRPTFFHFFPLLSSKLKGRVNRSEYFFFNYYFIFCQLDLCSPWTNMSMHFIYRSEVVNASVTAVKYCKSGNFRATFIFAHFTLQPGCAKIKAREYVHFVLKST